VNKSTTLIAGGAGYIGSTLVNFLLKKNHKVICLDNLVYGKKSIIPFLKKKNFIFIKQDIRDYKKVKKIFSTYKIDYVVNLAAIVGDKQCKTISKTAYDTNFNGNTNLFNSAQECSVKKYIFASTCSNYGIAKSNGYVDEKSKLNPVSLYAESKIDSENFLLSQINKNLEILILRFATAFGVSFRTRFDLTLNSFTYEAIKNKKIEVFAKDTWRPYVHVKDIARIIYFAIINKKKNNNIIFNAGFTKSNLTKEDLAKKIVNILPKTSLNFDPNITDLRTYKVSFRKLENTFNIKQKYSIDFGIKEILLNIKKKLLTENEIKNNYLDRNCSNLLRFYKNEN
jgi:nucleoside-diphosphate-sugar epimerase